MQCLLRVMLIAPDEELARENATYAQLDKNLIIPFSPVPGLIISVPCLIYDDHLEFENFLDLSKIAPQASSQFTVKTILYNVQYDEIILYTENEFYSTLEQFKAAQIFYIKGYGFAHTGDEPVVS